MGLLMLFSAFTGSRPGTLLADDNSPCIDSRESSTDDLSSSTLAYNSDGDTLIDGVEGVSVGAWPRRASKSYLVGWTGR